MNDDTFALALLLIGIVLAVFVSALLGGLCIIGSIVAFLWRRGLRSRRP